MVIKSDDKLRDLELKNVSLQNCFEELKTTHENLKTSRETLNISWGTLKEKHGSLRMLTTLSLHKKSKEK
jgi:hypothetical protein